MKLRCSKKNFKKKINIRKNTFFYFFNKYPISVIIKIIELFIIDNKKVTEIIKAICEYYKINSINLKVIYRMINLIRRAIAHYIKESYYTKLAINNENAKITIDESLFCHFNGNRQIWLIGLINTNTHEFRIEAVYERNSEIMEKIIKHHVGEGNFIITDGWGAYSSMDNPNSGYHRIIHIHGHHDFGHGDESTSHIEGVWADLKRIISRFYVSVKSCNFIYFAKEAEMRKKTSNLSIDKKLDNIKFIFNHISNTVEWDLFTKEEIENFEKKYFHQIHFHFYKPHNY